MSGQERNGDGKNRQEFKLFVGGLHSDTEKEDMQACFEQFGEVKDCVVMKDGVTRHSRGFGFVTFCSEAEMQACLDACPHTLNGKEVETKLAIPRGQPESSRSSQGEPQLQQTKKVFLGGLAIDTTEEDISEILSKHGRVVRVEIMREKEEGQKSRGFGFATFEEFDDVDKLVSKKYCDIKGRPVEVKKAIPQDEIRRGDGGRGRGPPAGNRGDYGSSYGGRESYQPYASGRRYDNYGGGSSGGGYEYPRSYYMRPDYMAGGGGGGGSYGVAAPGGGGAGGGYGMAAAMSGYGDGRTPEAYSPYAQAYRQQGYDMQSYGNMYQGMMGSYGNQGASTYGPSPRGYGAGAPAGGSGQDRSRDSKDRGGSQNYHPYRR